MEQQIKLELAGAESGAPLLVIPPRESVKLPHAEFKTALVRGKLPDMYSVSEFAQGVLQQAAAAGIRWATVLGIGIGANVAQALTVEDSKFVRRLILVDATTRLAPGFFTRLIDRVEKILPLGLPLRSLSKSFDSSPYLHRLRCPVLILSTPQASDHQLQQAELLASAIPNSYYYRLKGPAISDNSISAELQDLLREFQSAPAKRPQKNLVSNGQV